MDNKATKAAKEEGAINFLKYLVPPTKLKSIPVTDKDLPQLVEDAKIMYNLCFTQNGPYPGAYAIAHSQINDTRPLRFFVTAEAKILVNPVIINHTKAYVDKKEACSSFPNNKPIIRQRFHKITLECQTIQDIDGNVTLTTPGVIELSGKDAQIVQHELGHLNGQYIYDEDWTPEGCLEN
jgi:peptide deformylase